MIFVLISRLIIFSVVDTFDGSSIDVFLETVIDVKNCISSDVHIDIFSKKIEIMIHIKRYRA